MEATTLLFPAVHRLGFQAGQAFSSFFYNTATKIETNNYNINVATIVTILTDYRLLLDCVRACIGCVMRFPGLYKTWWWNMVAKDPLHVAIETIMLMSVVYMMMSRSTEGYKDSSKDKLTLREQEDLLWDWKHKTRGPLAPSRKRNKKGGNETNNTTKNGNIDDKTNIAKGSIGFDTYDDDDDDDDDFQIVVQKQEGKWLTVTVPNHWVTNNHNNSNSNSNSNSKCTTIENNNNNGAGNKVSNRNNKNSSNIMKTKNVKTNNGNEATAKAKATTPTRSPPRNETELRVLNFCNFDFLGFQTSEALKEASKTALNKYGCGSCGPRGFYGTIDAHLQLEEEISRFCKTDQAILYSDGASTCSSTVAAFAKRGDLLVVDEGVYEPLSTGVYLSRANVHWFRHNDVQDLERVLQELQATDRKLGRKQGAQRRFIVVEGLYKNMGTIAPLDEIVALKHKYKYRLILDESFSFGTLGKTGRGALEEHNKRPMYDAEITTIALENSIGSIGGVTVGNEEVVDHQRLSGAGYCFSASAPPFTASAAVASLRILEERPDLVQTLQSNVRYTYKRLLEKVEQHNDGGGSSSSNSNNDETKKSSCCQHYYKLVVTSDSRSPIVVLQLEQESVYESAIMSGIMRNCLQRGIAIVASTTPPAEGPYGTTSTNGPSTLPSSTSTSTNTSCTMELAPCIRMTVSALHTKEDTDKAIDVLLESAALVTSRYPAVAAATTSTTTT
jgi:7-keto-8-aminopelargonate synthetase-like enzyme